MVYVQAMMNWLRFMCWEDNDSEINLYFSASYIQVTHLILVNLKKSITLSEP